MNARRTDIGGRFAYAIAGFVLICSVVTMNLSLPVSALSLGGGNDTNSGLLSPVTNLLDTVTDKVAPTVTQPVTEGVLPAATRTLDTVTTPVTENVLAPVTNTLDNVLAPVTPIVQNTTQPVTQILSPITHNVLPTVTNTVNDITSPITGDLIPSTLDTVNNVVTPVTNAVTAPLQSPAVPSALRPIASTVPRLVNDARNATTLPTANRPGTVTPITTPVLSFANPDFVQPVSTNESFNPMSLVGSVISFFTMFPAAIQGLYNNNVTKNLDNFSVMMMTGVLGVMLIVFVSTIYMMIARGKYGVHKMGQNFMHETAVYGSMAKLSVVAFGTLGIGSTAIYLMLITL
jgi:hypothetical protein